MVIDRNRETVKSLISPTLTLLCYLRMQQTEIGLKFRNKMVALKLTTVRLFLWFFHVITTTGTIRKVYIRKARPTLT